MDSEKLFRLLRQAELHADTIRLEIKVSRMKAETLRANIAHYADSLAECERRASCHRSMLEQTEAAMMALLKNDGTES